MRNYTDKKPEHFAYSFADAGTALGVSKWTIWRLVQDGELLAVHIRRRRVVTGESLAAFLEKQKRTAINS